MTDSSTTLVTVPPENAKDSIIKTGYLLKYKTMKRKFFVLRCGATGISTLEYYDSEKKFLSGSTSKRAIQLNCCFNINKKHDPKHKYMLALYTRNDCFCIVLENEQVQDEWLEALIQLQPNREYNKSVPAFEHIWQVRLNSKGIGSSQNRIGNYQLCLTSKTVHLVKMLSDGDGDLEFPLSTIRRCGHSDCFFFMEVGRQAPTGSGELWMQVDDTVIAQNIHEATLNAMQSINQLEEMRPRSHSNNSNDNKSHRRPTGPSRRNRCDSMPAHITQSHLNSDREESQNWEEHVPHSPSSPSRSRQKYSPATRSNSNVFRPPNMFPKSVIKANSDSPPIPNSPLSESPQSFLDTERYMSTQCHSPDGTDYSSSPLDSLHRYGRTPESPTPTPIREESFESDEYINMSPSASSKARPVPLSSISSESSVFHYHDPPIAGAHQSTNSEASSLYSPMHETQPNPAGEEKDVYMNMELTASKSRITSSNSLDVPTKVANRDKLPTSISQDEGYIMMAGKIDNKVARRLSKSKKKSSSTDSQDSYMFMSPSSDSKEGKSQGKEKKLEKKSSKTSLKITRQSQINGKSLSQTKNNGSVGSAEAKETYVNVDFNSQVEKQIEKDSSKRNNSDMRSQRSNSNSSGKVRYTLTVTPQSGNQSENEAYTMMSPSIPNPDTNSEGVRSKNNLPKTKELDKNENVKIEYMNVNFSVKNNRQSNTDDNEGSSTRGLSDSSSDYMNMGFRNSKSPKSPVVPVSPILDKTNSLADCVQNMSFPSGGLRNLDLSPNGKASDGLGPPSHHSSRRSSQTSLQEEKELNYVDVDITNNESSQSSEGQRSRSPFQRRSDNDKPDQSITYASIDFTKSEGLRTIQSLRESRF
ncbi:uncharacterized protein [Antedon mediterranea]|uniref:uncharacterized protein isoform X2 n=1 Tax=Antedon mediterranea TaxID=105859 RepID=UPI003AF6A3A2